MRIGVPRETKDREYRVGLAPEGAGALTRAGHEVYVERGAGQGSGFPDLAYQSAGSRIVDCNEAWSNVDIVVKVKEPVGHEPGMLHPGQTLFTYLHLAAEPELSQALLDAEVRAIAYETVEDASGRFPLLAPMSVIAGRLATQIGAQLLLKEAGGKGVLLSGAPGVERGQVSILGAGIVGSNALRIAHALGARVTILDIDAGRLADIDAQYSGTIDTLQANAANIERAVATSDLVIGAVYISGRRAPVLVDDKQIAQMEPGSVVVDVAVDQGGCIGTIHPTTHSNPTYLVSDVVHYGVANMPGAVPRTATQALTSVTLPYLMRMAELGVEAALASDPLLAKGMSVWGGRVVCPGVAEAMGVEAVPADALLPGI
jgi:alanine dehydrogenase